MFLHFLNLIVGAKINVAKFQGEALYCFVTMNDGCTFDAKVETQLKTMIREKIAPFATPDFIQSAPGLPKTRSGKIMRRVLKKIANNEKDLGDISTMADSSVVEVRYINLCICEAN